MTKKTKKPENLQKRDNWPLRSEGRCFVAPTLQELLEDVLDWYAAADIQAIAAYDHEDDPSMTRYEAIVFRQD